MVNKKKRKFKNGDIFDNNGKVGCACGDIKNAGEFCDNCSTESLVDGGFKIIGIKSFSIWYSTSRVDFNEYYGEPDRIPVSVESSYPSLKMVADICNILSQAFPVLIMIYFFYNFMFNSMEFLWFFYLALIAFFSWLGYRFMAENIILFINIAVDVRDIKNQKK